MIPQNRRPVRLMKLENFTREEISTCFEEHDLTFKDPNDFCEKMTGLRYEYEETYETDMSDPLFERGRIATITLWSILKDIAGHPSHRHRLDALNIINEVKSREAGEDECVLIPEPLTLPYEGPDEDRLPIPYADDDKVLTLKNIEGRMPERMTDDPLPVPTMRILPQGLGLSPPAEIPENSELIEYLPEPGTLERLAAVREQIMANLRQGKLDPSLTPYTYRDDPGEKVLDMNDEIRFITAPTPEVDPRLLESSQWPKLDVYDNRLGEFGPLKPTSYIYKLFEWGRLTIAQPDIARAYCVIFRANPRRYNIDSGDELADEDPPQKDELECIIKLITHMTPSILISKNDPKFKSGTLGYHLRSKAPNAIQINGSLFDAVEKAHREGQHPAHMIYMIWITFIHECGHYYNTLIHRAPNDFTGLKSRLFSTPRKMRFQVSGDPSKEDKNFSTYDPWHTMRGEIGEVIEWLIFGYYPGTIADGDYAHLIYVIGWGSYPAQMGEQILFSSLIADRLLRTPMRLTCDQLRLYIQQVYAEVLQDEEADSDSDCGMTSASESEDNEDTGIIQYMDIDADNLNND